MAETNNNSLLAPIAGISRMPAARQIAIIIALAATFALFIAIVNWAKEPNYAPLYANLAERDTMQVVDALGRAGIPYRLDQGSGAVTVPAARLHEARLNLASQGLPRTPGFGFELLQEDGGLGTSRLVEQARHHRALEGELARSIMTLSSVESARVHLALPRQSAFVRDRTKPSASVLLNIYSGRTLDENQIAGIVHLVASSVPELETERVTVVDQRGRLLTGTQSAASGMALSSSNLDFTHRLEESYVRRILDIVSPIVGPEAVRAQVAADVDFSQVERTSESYDPEMSVLRSEQISEDQTRGAGFGAVPGALANQPPPAGVVAPEIAAVEGAGLITTEEPVNSSRRSTRNYEVDRTISHVRQAPGNLRRLSVAVVVDHRERVNEQGTVERMPLEPEELERITALVREAVGFDARRGDSVNVINASFRPLPEAEPMPEMPVWQEPWIADLVKWTLAALLILVLLLFVLRPMLRNLTAASHVRRPAQLQYAAAGGEMEGQPMLGEDRLSIGQPGALPGPKRQGDYEVHMETARNMAREDPKRVAQVVKTWLQTDGT